MPRLASARGVKKHWNYTVAEAAETTGVTRNTVHKWIGDGLQVVEGVRPYLIRGPDLRGFLDDRNARRKCPLKPGEIYCVACQAAQRPAGDMAEYEPRTATDGTLLGICPVCERLIRRHVSWTSLDDAANGLSLTIATADGTLRKLPSAPANHHFVEEPGCDRIQPRK